MEKVNLLKKKRLIFACSSLVLFIVTLAFSLASFKLVAESRYSVMWYFFIGSAITLYSSAYLLHLHLNFNLYYKVAMAVINEGTKDECHLESVLKIKARVIKKIISKCQKNGYIA